MHDKMAIDYSAEEMRIAAQIEQQPIDPHGSHGSAKRKSGDRSRYLHGRDVATRESPEALYP